MFDQKQFEKLQDITEMLLLQLEHYDSMLKEIENRVNDRKTRWELELDVLKKIDNDIKNTPPILQ